MCYVIFGLLMGIRPVFDVTVIHLMWTVVCFSSPFW